MAGVRVSLVSGPRAVGCTWANMQHRCAPPRLPAACCLAAPRWANAPKRIAPARADPCGADIGTAQNEPKFTRAQPLPGCAGWRVKAFVHSWDGFVIHTSEFHSQHGRCALCQKLGRETTMVVPPTTNFSSATRSAGTWTDGGGGRLLGAAARD